MLYAMGVEAFAERARRELAATGELTAQIARLARDGLLNPEIGSRLFISARGPLPPGQGLRQARH
jgi:DNA-binding NarL/FixJ family response regulator